MFLNFLHKYELYGQGWDKAFKIIQIIQLLAVALLRPTVLFSISETHSAKNIQTDKYKF